MLGALNMDSRTFLCQLPAVAAGLSTAKSMSRSRPAHAEQSGVIGFVTATFEDKAIARQRLPSATVQTMKQKLMSTQSFRQFQIAMQRSVSCVCEMLFLEKYRLMVETIQQHVLQ